MGGDDEPFADPARRDAKLKSKAQSLQRRFAELFPANPFKRDLAWTGTFVESPDGLPYIGPREPGSHLLYALGYGGTGSPSARWRRRFWRTCARAAATPMRGSFASIANPTWTHSAS